MIGQSSPLPSTGGRTFQDCLTTQQRLRHMYVIGATGTGKSTLFLNLMLQDAERGNGFALLDPHGDLIRQASGKDSRKYGLGLVIAHQGFRQLWDQSTEVAGSVLANPYTRICFRLGDFDARKLQEGFSYYEAQDLQNLGIGEAICKVERADYDFNLLTFDVTPVDQEQARQTRKRILEHSRKRYGKSRLEGRTQPLDVSEEPRPTAGSPRETEDTRRDTASPSAAKKQPETLKRE